jgi:hypothetical protein
MEQMHPGACIIFVLILMTSACSPAPGQPTSGVDTRKIPTSTHMQTKSAPTSSPFQQSTKVTPGTLLTGSGAVERRLLAYDDLMNGRADAPVDDGAFALPDEAAMPEVVLEGRLQISSGTETSGFKLIRDDAKLASDRARLRVPDLDLEFVQDGSVIIPVKKGLVYGTNRYWNAIIGPGRIWRENGDHALARVAFPFTLVERNQNCTHNGVMTFLFDGKHLSTIRYQITQETCLEFKFDLWGRAVGTYTPRTIPQAAALKAAHAAEVTDRLPTRPLASLASDFPDANFSETNLTAGISSGNMTLYGLVINGTNYISACNTRYGLYAFCEDMRVPSYSTAKSAFAAIALMRLGQKYGTGVYDLLVKDYLPEVASAKGDWSAVTFQDALDMATGNYSLAGFQADEYGANMLAFLNSAETYLDKIHNALQYPGQTPPGKVWIYHTSDTFLLTRAMNNYLLQQEGQDADIFNFVRDEVYTPLHLSAGALTSLRTDNSPAGAPFGGYGLFWTRDDIAKLAIFLNNQTGRINGIQVLEPGLLAAALQKNPDDRGLDTSGVPVFKYRASFWAYHWDPSIARQYPCSFWTPFMSGYGGITVMLMPNGASYYYFSDNNEFAWTGAVSEANKLSPMCP